MNKRKTLFATLGAASILTAALLTCCNVNLLQSVHAAGASRPSTVLHIVTIQWKDGVTAEQKASVVKATEEMAASLGTVKNLWLKPLKVQGEGYSDAMVMEFESKAAFDAYAASPAHKKWEAVYLPLRGESRTHDITN